MFVHVVAHEDDDLYFMNPDLSDSITAGAPVTTVYVTAGEISGTGATPGQRARSRQRGIMDAYAHMAGLDPVGDQLEWDADVWTVAGRQLDRYRLRGTSVTVVFVGLPDHQLASLDAGGSLTTVPATGGAGASAQTYNRAGVVALLAAVLTQLGATFVRSLDPVPDQRQVEDHPDHVATARLVADAAAACNPRPTVTGYRCYVVGYLPGNLSAPVTAAKQTTAEIYGAYDPAAGFNNYPGRMRERWPRGAQWAARDSAGRLAVVVVRAGRAWLWRQTATGWQAGVDLGNPGVALWPGIVLARDLDGRLEIIGRTADHRIVNRWQTSVNGGWYAQWGDLGNHNAGGANAPQMGTPIVMVNGDGRLQIAVKNGGGGLSSRWQTAPNAGWGPWNDMGGTDVQDGLAVALSPDSRLEVFAPTRTGVLHWYQTYPNSAMVLHTGLPVVAPSSELHATRGVDGRLRLAYRRDGGSLAVTRQAVTNGGWVAPAPASGPGGYGPVVLAPVGSQVQAYAVTPDGVTTATLAADGSPGTWAGMGGPTGTITAVPGSGGAVDLIGLTPDGRPQHWTSGTWVPLP